MTLLVIGLALRLDFTLVQLCRCKSAGTDLISKMVKTGTCRVVGLPQVCRSSATLQGSCTDSSRCNSAVQVCSLLFVYTVPEVTNSSNTLVYTVPWYPGTGTKVQFQGTVPVPWYKKGNNYAWEELQSCTNAKVSQCNSAGQVCLQTCTCRLAPM